MEMEFKILETIEEQIAVQFTGKVNVLSTFNRQYLGHLLFKDGELFQVVFHNQRGLKAFYQLIIQEFTLHSFNYVVEPEVVSLTERQIHYPYTVMKNKMTEVIKLYRDSLKFRPPENVKILIDAEFMDDTLGVTPDEFVVLEVLTEWNKPFDIYQHCSLLDHEITMALVSLRKKNALKIVAGRTQADDRGQKNGKIAQIFIQGSNMKSQKHNQGELKEIKVKIEKEVAENFEKMVKNTNIPLDDLVVIAMKRFASSHADYLKIVPMTE